MNVFKRLLKESKKQRIGIFIVIILSILAGPLKMGISLLWGQGIDMALQEVNISLIGIGIFMILLVCVDAVRTMLNYRWVSRTVEQIFFDIREKIFQSIIRAKYEIIKEEVRSGDTIARVTDDVTIASNTISDSISNYIRIFAQAIAALIACLFLSWRLTMIYIIILPINIIVLQKISEPFRVRRKKMLDIMGKSSNLTAEVIDNIENVKIFNLGKGLQKYNENILNDAFEETKAIEKIGILITVTRYSFAVLQLMLVFLIGVVLIERGNLTVGDLIAFTALSNYIKEFTEVIGYMSASIRGVAARLERIFEIVDIEAGIEGEKELIETKKIVDIREMGFSYKENKILEDINVLIKENQKIAIVGMSGSGKSTLLKLMSGFLIPDTGSMKFMGTEIKEVRKEILMSEISLIPQASILFAGSVRENLMIGNINTTDEKMINILKNIKLWDDLSRSKNGLDTQLSELGGNLSGGQQQRLSVGRGLIKDSRLLLIDEATSSVDKQTERDIISAIKSVYNQTIVMVTHSLEVAKEMDFVYVMKEGRIVEAGTHEALILQKGYYTRMHISEGVEE